MGELQREVLAEIHYRVHGSESNIFCACSRVFIRAKGLVDSKHVQCDCEEDSASEKNVALSPAGGLHSAAAAAAVATTVHFQLPACVTTTRPAHDVDTEISSSCYYSASHTDNISTDEHDSLRESQQVMGQAGTAPRGLHSSDSGADLSEHGHAPDEADTDVEWQRYWAQHGDDLVWHSWITKYRAYINPGYLDALGESAAAVPPQSAVSSTPPPILHNILKTASASSSAPGGGSKRNSLSEHVVSFNFHISDVDENGQQQYHSPLVRNLSGERLAAGSAAALDGWAQLSPVSVECEAEHERLLGSRCGSVASSTARTAATTDSMTNVTRMTVSSVELSDSSKGSGESLPSPISSVRSSSDHSSSDDVADTLDSDQYWQELWKQHYHDQYHYNYSKFVGARRAATGALLRCNPDDWYWRPAADSYESTDSVGNMLEMLEMDGGGGGGVDDGAESSTATNDNPSTSGSGGGGGGGGGGDTDADNGELRLGTHGLPVAFGRQRYRPANVDDDDDEPLERPATATATTTTTTTTTTIKRRHEADDESAEQMKKAYSLLGLAHAAGSTGGGGQLVRAQVVYKKKHIRLQNRHLNMNFRPVRPHHLYFDDDGNLLADPIDKVKLFLQSQAAERGALSMSSDDESSQLPSVHANSVDSTTPQTESTLVDEVAMAATPPPPSPPPPPPPIATDCTLPDLSEYMSVDYEMEPAHSLVDDDAEPPPPPPPPLDPNRTITSTTIATTTAASSSSSGTKRKEKKKKKRNNKLNAMPSEIKDNPALMKYWFRRFSLFSKFDEGVRLDEESWFSVTPEKVARHTAERCQCDVLVDAFCGAGGNAIQFALTCHRVIAVDIDARKIALARHNAQVYGVAERIEFVVGDFLALARRLRADVVYLSPPWGGPKYLENDVYDLETMLLPVGISAMLEAARAVSHNVALFLPRNSNVDQLVQMAGSGGSVEIEQNFLDKKLIALTAYYGELLRQ